PQRHRVTEKEKSLGFTLWLCDSVVIEIDYFAVAESCLTVAMNVVVGRVWVRSRRYASPSSRQSSTPWSGSSFTLSANTWSRAKLELISETPSPAATKLLIIPMLGSSILT